MKDFLFFIPIFGFFYKLYWEWQMNKHDRYIPRSMRQVLKFATAYQIVCSFLFGRFIIAPLIGPLIFN